MNLFEKIIVLDGAMGTELVKAKAPMGKIPEELNIDYPEIVKKVHRSYLEKGANLIYTNTFGANGYKCKDSKYTVEELITAAVKNAKEEASSFNALVGLSMGTIGDILEPFGNLKFEDAYEIYKEMVIAGEKAGADVLVFETQTDLLEVKAGVLAAKENTKLPVFVTMTFEANGRTFTGTKAESMAITLESLGVDAIGVNCSLGPDELLPIVKRMREVSNLPLIVKPNAGLPNPMTGEYSMDAASFAKAMVPFLEMGVSMVGGCCGTNPEFIGELAKLTKDYSPKKPETVNKSFLCSNREYVDCSDNRIHVVGERINPTGKKAFKEALINNDIDYIKARAMEQEEAGAQILDVNVGLPQIDEEKMMVKVVKELQTVTGCPLQIDSSNSKVLESALRVYNGKALINSVNGEDSVLDTILPIAKKYGAAVIGLTMNSDGIPSKSEDRVAIAGHIVEKCKEYGIGPNDIYIDCLTLACSVQQKEAFETLKAIKAVKEKYGVHTVLGVSNISFGLPKREYINTTFLTLAMEAGLDLPILNPNTPAMMAAVDAFEVLSCKDEKAYEYVEKYAAIVEKEKAEKENQSVNITKNTEAVSDYIQKGLGDLTASAVSELLKTMEPLDIVNNKLIPALDLVGEKFEKGSFFLPQLLSAAQAAEAGFGVIKEYLAKTSGGGISKGKVVLATVKGDVHDIGKNIVKTILENYGFTVIDLGKDVPGEEVVEAVKKHGAKLVGLSALMTTTVVSMADTIKMLKEAKLDCKVMVGGAVLTPEYALTIGADYYSKDAKQSADIAKEVYGV